MTDQPGASNILSPPAPVSPEAAAARMAELDATPAFQERVKAGDAKAFEERTELWRIAHGLPAKPQVAINEVDILTQMGGRAVAGVKQQADDLRSLGFSELAIYEHLNRRPIPLAEHQDAQRKLAQLKG
jgi:hypothetical protein